VLKAFAVRDADDLDPMQPYRGIADRFPLDAKPPLGPELPGGHGVGFDWSILTSLDEEGKYMLSGGLDASTLGQARAAAKPSGIDISSGVESAPGIKDPEKIRAFFRAVRAAIANEERHDQAD